MAISVHIGVAHGAVTVVVSRVRAVRLCRAGMKRWVGVVAISGVCGETVGLVAGNRARVVVAEAVAVVVLVPGRGPVCVTLVRRAIAVVVDVVAQFAGTRIHCCVPIVAVIVFGKSVPIGVNRWLGAGIVISAGVVIVVDGVVVIYRVVIAGVVVVRNNDGIADGLRTAGQQQAEG